MPKSLRPIAHIAAIAALAAWALGLGRWLRDPGVDASLLGLVVISTLIALALRQLYYEDTAAPVVEPVRDTRIDINTATMEELRTLPGVGPVAAAHIIRERDIGGPFASPEALTRVPGFGPAKVRALADLIRTS